jgi:hypothetical protein
MNEFLIWKDTLDKDTFHFGIKVGQRHVIWTSVFCDALFDLFGSDFANSCKELEPGKSRAVQASLILLDH